MATKPAPKKTSPKKPKKPKKKVTAAPSAVVIQLQVLYSQTPGTVRWDHPVHSVVGATVAKTGGPSAVTNNTGSARFALSALPPGAHTFSVTPHSTQTCSVPAGPTLGTGAATDPAFMFRPFSVTVQVDASGFVATPAPSIALTAVAGAPPHAVIFSQTPTLLVIDWKADWVKTANQTAATGRTVDCLVIHQTSEPERIGNHLNTFTTPTSEASAHYLVDTDGHVVKLVHESQTSWHAGASFWQGATGVNNFSVGIETVHSDVSAFHDFTAAQYAALLRLVPLIRTAHTGITRQRVTGHSDVEVRGKHGGPVFHFEHGTSRPQDPGKMFEWNRLEAAGQARRPVGIASLSPGTIAAGSAGFTLTVTGTGFTATAVILWAGLPLATTFVDATTLTAPVIAAQVAVAGVIPVTIVSGGSPTPPVNFIVSGASPITPPDLKIYGIKSGQTLAAGAPGGVKIAELKRDLLAIGHPINDADGVTVNNNFDHPLTGAVQRFQTRHFSGARRTSFTGTPGVVDFATALAIKQVLADAGP